MCKAPIDATVRLTRGEPTLWLQRGDVGVIRSVWHFPNLYYEVEICKSGEPFGIRALLAADQVEVIAPPPPPPPPPLTTLTTTTTTTTTRALAERHLDGEGQQP
jgi:hypothetical protein